MKKLILWFVVALVFLLSNSANAYVSVKGYYKANGTYVQPYVRSNPNGLKSDNYSYTGGTVYNPSYGTKGTTWDTPTTVTDPNYYVGKNYYDTKTVPQTFMPQKSDTPPIAAPYLNTPAYTPPPSTTAPLISKTQIAQYKKLANQHTLDQWARMLVNEFNAGRTTWDKAVSTYAFIKQYHD